MRSVEHAGSLIAHRGIDAPRTAEVVRDVLLGALVVGMAASISLTQIALALLAGWVLVARRSGWIPPLRWPLLLPALAFAAWTVVAALASARPGESLVEAKGLLNIAALFVIVNALPGPAGARRFTTWLVLALAGAALFALAQVAVCPGSDFTASASLTDKLLRKCGRARGFFSIYMTLAGVLAIMLAGTLPRLARLGADARWLGPAWVVAATALALTYVRGAWLGLAAGALAALAGLGRRGLYAAAALAVLGLALVIALPEVRHRAATIGDPTNDTTRDRMAMIEVGLRLTGAHPLAGIGPGQLRHIYAVEAPSTAMRRATSHVHNTPLQIALQSGVVGLAAWLWFFVAFFRRGVAVMRRLPTETAGDRALVLGSLAAVVTFLVGGLFEFNFGDTEVLLVALAFMALPFVLTSDDASTEPCRPA